VIVVAVISAAGPLMAVELWQDGRPIERGAPDGSGFGSPETITATFEVSLSPGSHTVFIRVINQEGLVSQSDPLNIAILPAEEATSPPTPEKIVPAATALDATVIPDYSLPPGSYGRHYPHGLQAVNYLFSPEGTWKEMIGVEYIWNYYRDCATLAHPLGKERLIQVANGDRVFTAPDANCHLLLDWDHDGEVDIESGGYAFHEHNGKGRSGYSSGKPFTVFWFDDNWLGRYMTEAYGRQNPDGLSAYDDFNRWAILGFGTQNWEPYPESDNLDQIALNGLYFLAVGNLDKAVHNWDRIRDLSAYFYNRESQQNSYPAIKENYHLGLFQILTSFLLDAPGVGEAKEQELLEHWVSLRSTIISNQERDGKAFLGWRSHTQDPRAFINTESTVINALSLGAGALHAFEPGAPPLKIGGDSYFLRPYHAISAVAGVSSPGYLSLGPDIAYPEGHYRVDFLLRAPSPSGRMALVDVHDVHGDRALASLFIEASSLNTDNTWTRFTLPITVDGQEKVLAFRIYWYGTANLDISAIRVRR
jgi:hypothetical protein